MDNAQKAIMIGVGLFITIIIISAVLLITNLGTDLIDDAAGEVNLMTENLKRELITQYDGKVLRPDEMLQCVQKYIDRDSIGVAVKLENGTILNYGGVLLTMNKSAVADDFAYGGVTVSSVGKVITKIGSNTKPSAYATLSTAAATADSFRTAIVYDTTGAVVGIAAIEN